MLGKLIRYDSKVQIRFLCGIYIVAALISGISGIFLGLRNQFPDVMIFKLMSGFARVICCLSVLVVFLGTIFYIVAYFRRNLLRDEGYLMHTLPVSSLQLYGSKLLTGTFFVYLSVLVGYLCFGVGNLRFRYSIIDEILKDGVDRKTFLLIGVTLLFVVPLLLCQFYFSLVLGYTWKMNTANPVNKDLLSVIAYIVTYMVQQAVALVGLLAYFMIRFGSPLESGFLERVAKFAGDETGLQTEMISYIQGLMWISLITSVIFGIVLFVLSVYRLNRHLNLE